MSAYTPYSCELHPCVVQCLRPRNTCRTFVLVTAELRPSGRYRITTGASAGVLSTAFFGSQPLTTREPGMPDAFTFTVVQAPARFEDVFRDLLDGDPLRVLVEPEVR